MPDNVTRLPSEEFVTSRNTQSGSDGNPKFVALWHVILDKTPTITPYGLALYAFLSKHANHETGEAFPSIKRLATLTGLTEPTVRKYLDILEMEGIIRREKQQSPDGQWANTHYFLLNLFGQGVVNDVYQGGKGDLVGVVNDVYQGGKGRFSELEPLNYNQEDKRVNKNLLFPGAVHDTHTPEKKQRVRKVAKPINEENWPTLKTLLETFELPLLSLDDDDFWNSLSYTAPTVLQEEWLKRELAKVWQWLHSNPSRKPTTQWQKFLRNWLNRAYEKERTSQHATARPQQQRTGYRS